MGEGNGNPLLYSCLESPVDRGAWWAAVHGVAQSRTRLKHLSMHACIHWRRKWPPTPVFLPGESQGWWSLVGCHIWGRTESDTTEVTQQQQQQQMNKTHSFSSQCHLKGIYSHQLHRKILTVLYSCQQWMMSVLKYYPFWQVWSGILLSL